MPRLRACSLIAPFVVLALLGAGCGDDDTDAATDTSADDVLEDQGTETETETEPDPDPEADADAADATVDALLDAVERTRSSESAVVELAIGFDGGALLGSQAATVSGPVTLDGTRADLRVSVDDEPDRVRFVVVDDRSWVGGEGDEVRAALPEGADWVELTTEQLLESPDFSNPGNLAFLYLAGGAADIEVDGSTYRFTVDLDAAAASAPSELRAAVAESLSFTGEQEPEITGEAELDDEGRITRLEVVGVQRPTEQEIERLDLDPDTAIRASIATRISDLDEPVDVEAPDGEVVSLADAPGMAAMLSLRAG